MEEIVIADVAASAYKNPNTGQTKSMRIQIIDSQGRELTGFVPLSKYSSSDWIPGSKKILEITKNKKWLNFRLPEEQKSYEGAKVPSTAQTDKFEQLMNGMKNMSLQINELNKKVQRLIDAQSQATTPYKAPVNQDADEPFPDYDNLPNTQIG